jgi:hypothetical protein
MHLLAGWKEAHGTALFVQVGLGQILEKGKVVKFQWIVIL